MKLAIYSAESFLTLCPQKYLKAYTKTLEIYKKKKKVTLRIEYYTN